MKNFVKSIFSSLFFQFTMFFLLVSVIPIFIYGSLLYNRSANLISSQSLNYSYEILRQVSGNIDVLVEDIDTLSIMPYTYRTSSYMSIQDFLSSKYDPDSGSDFIDERNEYKMFEEFLKYTLNTKKYIKTVTIITKNGKVYYEDKKGDFITDYYDFRGKVWMETIANNPEGLTILTTRRQDYFSLKNHVVTFARNILDTKNITADLKEMIVGTLLIDLRLDVLAGMCDGVLIKKQGRLMIVDSNGNTVYSSNPGELGIMPEWYDRVKSSMSPANFKNLKYGSFTRKDGDVERIYNYYANAVTGWTILNIIDRDELLKDINGLKEFYKVILIMFLLELPFMLLIFHFKVSLPVRGILSLTAFPAVTGTGSRMSSRW